jgi:hypothetical protein
LGTFLFYLFVVSCISCRKLHILVPI